MLGFHRSVLFEKTCQAPAGAPSGYLPSIAAFRTTEMKTLR
jgi:hypothetical protein